MASDYPIGEEEKGRFTMRMFVAGVVAAVLLLTLAPVIRVQADDTSVEKSLLKLERDWVAALEKRDTKVIAPLLAKDFISVEPDGSLLNKKNYLEARMKDQELESSSLEQMQVRVYGPTATVTGLQTSQVKRKGEKVTERYRYVDVFILQDGAWKCVSTQVTPLPAKK
jgi:ketosteroid isomerase-like protein